MDLVHQRLPGLTETTEGNRSTPIATTAARCEETIAPAAAGVPRFPKIVSSQHQ
jgi:hypothetical protein